jgi:hypothetical protein
MNTYLYYTTLNRCKTGIFILCALFCFAWQNTCSAQSILGKWNQLKIKTFYTAAGAVANGNHAESVINMSDIGTGVFVFYSNHTYRQETTTGDSKVKTLLGTWTLTGDQLVMQLLAQQEDPKDNPAKGTPAEKTTVTFKGNIMEWTTMYTNNPNIIKIVLTLASNS